MSDCPILFKEIARTKFNTRALTKIISLYNNCNSLTRSQLYSPDFTGDIALGVTFIDGSINSSEGYTNGMKWSFEPALTVYLSGGISPPRKKNIGIGVEGILSKRVASGISTIKDGYDKHEYLLSLNYYQISTGLKFTHNISNSEKRIWPSYSISFGRTFVYKANTELWIIDSSFDTIFFPKKGTTDITSQDFLYLGLEAGVNIVLEKKYRLSLNIRFDRQSDQITGDGISKSTIFCISPVIKLGIK